MNLYSNDELKIQKLMKLKTIYLPLIGGLALACQAAGETDAPGVKANEATKTETVDAAGDEETTPATETIPVYVVKSAGGG